MKAEEERLKIDEAALVLKLQASDPMAWQVFIELYGVVLAKYLRHMLPTEEDVGDLLQEVFGAAVRTITQFPKEVTLRTWVYSLAYRKVTDFWRRQQHTVELSAVMHSPLREALAQMPELMQQALLLRYHVGLSISEIAEILGRSIRATESLLQRCRQQLLHSGDERDWDALFTEHSAVLDSPTAESRAGTIYSLLLLQQRVCAQAQLTAEAAIFARARQALDQMAAIPTGTVLETLTNQVAQDPALLIRQWLTLQANHPTESQP